MRETETDDGILKSVFVPPFGLQGQELSCHVTWNRQCRLRELRLSYDKGLRCIHVYNVSEKGLSLANGGRSVRISRVSENGYAGFVLKSDLLETPDALLSVSVSADFDFAKSHRRLKRTFKVRLFRPDLRVDAPELIRVKFPAGEVTPQVFGERRPSWRPVLTSPSQCAQMSSDIPRPEPRARTVRRSSL